MRYDTLHIAQRTTLSSLLPCLLPSSAEGMSDEELQEKALGVAKHTLGGKTDLERAAILHQHIGSRAMGDMVIETFEPSPGENMHVMLQPISGL